MSRKRRRKKGAPGPKSVPGDGPARAGGTGAGRQDVRPAIHAPAARDLSLLHPAAIAATLVAAACIAITVSFRLWETDVWQHLLVGKAIWELGHVPTTQLWSWPTYGAPDVNSSWGFRALLWPVWNLGEVPALFAWRWVTTLGAFALLWAAARRMGARGLAPLFVLAVCALTWRYRSQIRPETLVALLIAAQIWILEVRRSGGPDRSLWLIPLALVWANVHISYHLGFLMIGMHVLNDWVQARRAKNRTLPYAPNGNQLLLIGVAAFAVSFLNPFGWRALWQPFDYFLNWRNEPIFQAVIELKPLFPQAWMGKVRTGLLIVMAAWPVMIALRARRHGLDLVEVLACLLYTSLTVSSVRFAGFYALVAAPYVARDLDGLIRDRAWPAWTSPAWVRAGAVSVACVAASMPEWSRAELPIAVGYVEKRVPERACDFMEAHGVKGRGFNQFYLGGYMLWRFWPDQERLPFMDIHQSGTRDDQRRYATMFVRPDGWQLMNDWYRFDYALLDATQHPAANDRSRDMLDADTTFAMVFRDDAAALYVRRSEPFRDVIGRSEYRQVPGGDDRLPRLGQACVADTAVRVAARGELERQIAESPWNARARSLLANIEVLDGNLDAARTHLEAAVEQDPELFAARERLGMIAMEQGRTADAVREFEAALETGQATGEIFLRLAEAYQEIGEVEKSRKFYNEVLKRTPERMPPPEGPGVQPGDTTQVR